MEFLAQDELEQAIGRFSQLKSLYSADRVCLVYANGRLEDLQRQGMVVHRVVWDAPWYLRPLGDVAPFRVLLAEVHVPDPMVELATTLEDLQFYSFSRTCLPAVLRAPASVAFLGEVADVAGGDPTFGELIVHSDAGSSYWTVWSRMNSQCPPDLAAFLAEFA
jgi:hypothetical protein